jgi:hypothetical protein
MVEHTRRHTVELIARARDSKRLYGGDDERFIATTLIGRAPEVDPPDFTTGPRNRTETSQQNFGLVYALLWKDVGELSVGLQRAMAKLDDRSRDRRNRVVGRHGAALQRDRGRRARADAHAVRELFARSRESRVSRPRTP